MISSSHKIFKKRRKNVLKSKELKVNITITTAIKLERGSGIHRRLKSVMNYECDRCKGNINDEKDEYMKPGCDEIETAKKFHYLSDIIGKDDSSNRAVTSRIPAQIKKI